jgi:hypothetical protein
VKRWIAILSVSIALAVGVYFAQPQPAQSQPEPGFKRPATVTPSPVRDGITINGPVEIKPHTLARLKVDGADAKSAILWRIYPPEKVDKATTSREILEFTGPPGEYTVEVLVISNSPEGVLRVDEARHKLRIGEPTPPPPPPPPDPLARELQALYQADTSPTKRADLGLLVELFRQAGSLANDPGVTTLSQLAERVAGAGASLLPRERLQSVRRRIGQHVAVEFGDQDATLTPSLRSKASATYQRISDFLRAIGGE